MAGGGILDGVGIMAGEEDITGGAAAGQIGLTIAATAATGKRDIGGSGLCA